MAKAMRILVVGAVTGGTVPMGRSICNAFVSLGQQTYLLDFSDLLPQFTAVGASGDARQIQAFVMGLRARLLAEVARFQPEIILGMAQSPLNNTEILSQFRKAGIKLCYWFVEDYRLFAYWKNIAASFDHFYTIQKEPFFAELKAIGCKGASYLPTAFDDLAPAGASGSIAPVQASARPAQSIPVSFVGAPYPNRVHWFQRLAGTPFQIFGEGWNKEMNPAVARGDRLTPAECQDIYSRTVINLNLHSDVRPEGFGDGDFVNPRTFEIAGLGRFQLTDARQLLPLHFDAAGEVPAFHNWREFQSAIEYFLAHAEERKAIAENARRRVLSEHTYRHRAQEILSNF
jgi:spore maturation protein CgeB